MLHIPKEHLKSLITRDSFFASEIAIFEAVVRWKDHNGFEAKDIEDVLGCVRLVEIPTKELVGVVEPSGVYPKTIIKEALKKNMGQPRGKVQGTYVGTLILS